MAGGERRQRGGGFRSEQHKRQFYAMREGLAAKKQTAADVVADYPRLAERLARSEARTRRILRAAAGGRRARDSEDEDESDASSESDEESDEERGSKRRRGRSEDRRFFSKLRRVLADAVAQQPRQSEPAPRGEPAAEEPYEEEQETPPQRQRERLPPPARRVRIPEDPRNRTVGAEPVQIERGAAPVARDERLRADRENIDDPFEGAEEDGEDDAADERLAAEEEAAQEEARRGVNLPAGPPGKPGNFVNNETYLDAKGNERTRQKSESGADIARARLGLQVWASSSTRRPHMLDANADPYLHVR